MVLRFGDEMIRSFNTLSDGQRSMLAMVGELAPLPKYMRPIPVSAIKRIRLRPSTIVVQVGNRHKPSIYFDLPVSYARRRSVSPDTSGSSTRNPPGQRLDWWGDLAGESGGGLAKRGCLPPGLLPLAANHAIS